MKISGDTKLLTMLGVAAGAGHIVYPIALAALCRVRGARAVAPTAWSDGEWPGITAVVPAFREVSTIARKVEDLRANGYPGELTVIVVSEDAETAAAARATGVTVIEPATRIGKSQALNAGVAAATTPIIVQTDANNLLEPGALEALAAHFADPRVGAVGGAKTELEQGEALYWRFESWLKSRETALGTTVGLVGELFAVRRELWRPIPVDIGTDDLWTALDVIERGHVVRYEPAAMSIEPGVPPDEQWVRRTRVVAGVLHVVHRKLHMLDPRRGLVAFEIIGHRLWRSTVGPVAHVALVLAALAAFRRNPLAKLVVTVHLAGLGAFLAARRGRVLPRPLAALAQVLYLQVVGLAGFVRFVRRGVAPAWEKQAR